MFDIQGSHGCFRLSSWLAGWPSTGGLEYSTGTWSGLFKLVGTLLPGWSGLELTCAPPTEDLHPRLLFPGLSPQSLETWALARILSTWKASGCNWGSARRSHHMMVNTIVEESLVGKPTAYLFWAASGLSCSMWDHSLWCTRSLSWCVGSVAQWHVWS